MAIWFMITAPYGIKIHASSALSRIAIVIVRNVILCTKLTVLSPDMFMQSQLVSKTQVNCSVFWTQHSPGSIFSSESISHGMAEGKSL